MPTLTDIAKAAGVSPAVVSRVVNEDKTLRISKETLERVKKIVEEQGYTPNRAARSLRSSESGLIALMLHDVSNPVYAEITRGAHNAASSAGKAILISDASSGSDGASRMINLIGGHGIDGLILQADQSSSDLVLAKAAKEKLPTVLLQADLGNDMNVIALPDQMAAKMGTDYLVQKGHKRIACIATEENLSFTRNRVTGWQEALKSPNADDQASPIAYTLPTIEGGRQAAANLLKNHSGFTAILCCNVVSAIGALAEVLDQKLRVPEDIAIVAIHDIPLISHLRVPLTTISMPLFSLGRMAVENVLKPSADGKNGPQTVDELPKLIERESS